MDKYQFCERLVLPVYNLRYQSKRYRIAASNIFEVKEQSEENPYTGMNHEKWLESAEYLLNGVFKYVQRIEDPLIFPKQKGKSYPKIFKGRKKIAYVEGLCRSLFIAIPVLNEKPDLILNGIPVAEYYQKQLTSLVNSSSATFVPDRKVEFPSQPLVEFGCLAISFFLSKDILWNPLTQEIKDKLALKMLSYGEGPYVDNNWKYFGVFILSFLKSEGYQVDEDRLELLLTKILDDYSGDGWYLDDSYDYYSMWGYQLYAAIWSKYYGEKYYSEVAERLKNNFKEMLSFYPYLFAQDGKMLMWGRSITYRFGAVAPLLFSSWSGSIEVNYGWLRRISSGALLKFLGNATFLRHGIPTLGFYGPFEPCIQGYSCRASSFWLGKAYLGLTESRNNLFWGQRENNGPWEHYDKHKSYSYFSNASKIAVTHYAGIGETEIRTCTPRKINSVAVYMRNENYNRLSYHTSFPWQSDTKQGTVAMNYLIKESNKVWEPLRQYEFISYEEGMLRRRVKLDTYADTVFDLVDIPLSNGTLRVDRITVAHEKQIRFGHYALPEKSGSIRNVMVQTNYGTGKSLDNGKFQLLAVPVSGWKDIYIVPAKNIHPEAKKSAVLNLSSTVQNEVILISLLLFKKSGEEWKKEEYNVIEKLEIEMSEIKIKLRDNRRLNWKW